MAPNAAFGHCGGQSSAVELRDFGSLVCRQYAADRCRGHRRQPCSTNGDELRLTSSPPLRRPASSSPGKAGSSHCRRRGPYRRRRRCVATMAVGDVHAQGASMWRRLPPAPFRTATTVKASSAAHAVRPRLIATLPRLVYRRHSSRSRTQGGAPYREYRCRRAGDEKPRRHRHRRQHHLSAGADCTDCTIDAEQAARHRLR